MTTPERSGSWPVPVAGRPIVRGHIASFRSIAHRRDRRYGPTARAGSLQTRVIDEASLGCPRATVRFASASRTNLLRRVTTEAQMSERDQVPFPATEYSDRLDRVRKAADDRGLDLLVLTDPKNICYLTGYDTYAFYVTQALLVPVSGEQPRLIVRGIDVTAAQWTTRLSDDQILGYGDEFVVQDAHPMAFVADVIKANGWHHLRIAVECDGGSFSPLAMRILEHELPDARFADSRRLVEWVRCIKSTRELAVMCEAGKISDHAMSVALEAIAPGVAEPAVAAAIYAALVEGVDGLAGSSPWQPYMAAGQRTNSPHCRWTDRRYRVGEPTMIELGAHRHNYAAGLSRTVFLGDPPDAYRALDKAVQRGMAAALDKLKAGYRAEDVKQAWQLATTARGVEKGSRIGYSIGLSFPDTCWVERTVSLAAGDRTVLQPHMTIHLMLAVWLDKIGHSLSETFIITEGEPESVSSLPRQLTVTHTGQPHRAGE
ncbi:MAG: M24 family metallopeptidase [Streptosporangiales bacterium]|nr:M24 family metallopeptidase [Streptosporangiales bacterium]